jgi:hypothetical protein
MVEDTRQISVVLRRFTVAGSGKTVYQIERIVNAFQVDCSAQDEVITTLAGVDDFLTEELAENLCKCPRYQTTVMGKRRV